MNHWSLSASTPIVLLLVALWVAAGWLCWANWARRRGAGVAAMEALRFVIMTLIGFTLLQPEWVRRIVRTEPPEVVILADSSASMDTRDVALDTARVWTRREWVDDVLQTNFFAPLEPRAKVRIERFAQPGTNDPSLTGTDLDAALQSVLQRGSHLKAVLVLSDGDWNVGRSPLSAATAYRAQRVPIYTVVVGADEPLPDLVLEQVTAPSYGLLGEQIAIPFTVQSHLSHEVLTTITLAGPQGTAAQKEIVIPPRGRLEEHVVWAPQALGDYVLTLRLPVQPDEYLVDNNEETFRVSIRTERLRVLVIESQPRWEYRYLRNALLRDPGVEAKSLLFHPELSTARGSNYLQRFPTSAEELARYDVVFLGDVGLGGDELSARDIELLRGLVEQQGSGLVFLPGRRGRQLTLVDTPLGELLPVRYDPTQPKGLSSANEATLQLTRSGRRHFLTLLANDEQANEFIWRHLPGFYWCAGVAKARPGSDVLAVHSNLRNATGRLPLLVTRPFGNGEVLFMGTDSAWRWRRGVEDKYHYRFWGQVVRWMAHKRHMARGTGLRLAFSPEVPQAGQHVYLQATLLNLAGVGQANLQAEVQAPSGTIEQLSFNPVAEAWGVYQALLVPQEGGLYKVRVRSDTGGRELETEIMVRRRAIEKKGQPANSAILREIAGLTGGRSGGVHELPALVQALSVLPDPEPQEQRVRLWANPWWGGLIVFLLGVYWTARKVAGMV